MNAVYKTVLCLLRRFLKSDKYAAPIAGFLAGLCIAFEAKSRRKLLVTLFLSRIADISYSLGEAHGLCYRFTGGAILLWLAGNLSQQYALAFESDTMNAGLRRFLEHWSLMYEPSARSNIADPDIWKAILTRFNQGENEQIASQMLSNWQLRL